MEHYIQDNSILIWIHENLQMAANVFEDNKLSNMSITHTQRAHTINI